jgi:hypothetical protein
MTCFDDHPDRQVQNSEHGVRQMDSLDELVKLIIGLAWPGVVLVAVLVFRKELTKLLGRITSVKYKDAEIDFKQGLMEAEHAAQGMPRMKTKSAVKVRDSIPNAQYASDPKLTILNAWHDIQNAVADAGGESSLPMQQKVKKIGLQMEAQGTLKPDQREALLDTVLKLADVRNSVAQVPDYVVTPNDAARFADLASNVVDLINPGN